MDFVWILLSSAVLSALISSIIAQKINDKNQRLKYITNERAKWRRDIRDRTEQLVSKFSEDERTKTIVFFIVRLNPDDEHDNKLLECIKNIRIENRETLNPFLEAVSRLLKHDWERVKIETRERFFVKRKLEKLDKSWNKKILKSNIRALKRNIYF